MAFSVVNDADHCHSLLVVPPILGGDDIDRPGFWCPATRARMLYSGDVILHPPIWQPPHRRDESSHSQPDSQTKQLELVLEGKTWWRPVRHLALVSSVNDLS